MFKTYFNWSSGKDSSLARFKVLKEGKFDVSQLVTTVNKDYKRVSMHGLREELLDLQSKSLEIPLKKIELPAQVNMDFYNKTMTKTVNELKEVGFTACVFGDIFLEDLRSYREAQLRGTGIKPHFPLWNENTKDLYFEFITLGFKAITVCVNANYLDKSFCGRVLDQRFFEDLPPDVDPCGENGEFHTFVYDGPIFKNPVSFEIGEKVLRTYEPSSSEDDNDCFSDQDQSKNWDTSFWYCDLIPN